MDDIICGLKDVLEIPNLQILESQSRNYVLLELKKLFNKNCCSFSSYNLPIPNRVIVEELSNKLLREALNSDVHQIQWERIELFKGLNEEHKLIYDAILNVVQENKGGLFFVQ